MKKDTTTMLGMEDIIVKKVEEATGNLHIHIELPRKAHTCPCCGQLTVAVHDYREQIVKDIPLGRTTYLHLRKRRYRCTHCGKRFAEQNPFLPRYYRMTSRLIARIIHEFKHLKSATAIAKENNISVTTTIRYFDCVEYRCPKLPRVLSIDEFKGNAGGEKYQSILTDAENKRILDILPNRYEGALIQYFKAFPSRFNVEFFITDMNPHFRSVAKACFPNAKIIADRFHVSRQASWAMERVRKNEQKKLSDKFRRYFKRSKYLLNKKTESLTEEELHSLSLIFEISPRLADAYRFKNEFYTAMKSHSSAEGKVRLTEWMRAVSLMDLPEFDDCSKAVRNWFTEILNSFDCPYTNGYTEGCNNKTKVLKRISFGVRNFDRFRNRILFCAARP